MATEVPIKERLGAALKEQLRTKPLGKVTVSSLADQAGITRQAFYYHFTDVFDLAVWVFETEVAGHILSHATYTDWAAGYEQLLQYMQGNREQTYRVIKSLSHQDLQMFFYREYRAMMEAIVREKRGDLEVSEASIRFVVDHFAKVVLGYTMHWLATGMRADPQELVRGLELLLRGQVRAALEDLAE